MDWLQRISDALSSSSGLDVPPLDDATRAALLDVARTASHTSGDRTNAPLLCYVLGSLAARGASLDEAIEVVERTSR